MRWGRSIRARLILGAAILLPAFIVAAGLALQRANAQSIQAAHFSRLQGIVYLLLARAELGPGGRLAVAGELEEPQLTLPGSGLYAAIHDAAGAEVWRSPSALGAGALAGAGRPPPGRWALSERATENGRFLAVAYTVRWADGKGGALFVLSVLQERSLADREQRVFDRTLWIWLAVAAVTLLLAQLALLHWGLSPLRQVAREIRRIEQGRQDAVSGTYPSEIAGLTSNLNALLQHERARRNRHREALSFLAHSLKTPLAVLRNALGDPQHLPQTVAEQVARMDNTVQYQLARAMAGRSGPLAPPLPIAPVLLRIRDALAKVHAARQLALAVDCPADLSWRISEDELFEMMGNVMENAAKWARSRVEVFASLSDGGHLLLRVDDDGPGFSGDAALLQLHVRGDERVPGHGVGLAVVHGLVTDFGGQLSVSRSPQGGARVQIELPRAGSLQAPVTATPPPVVPTA